MSENFRIKETIDADGHRVVVYEFFASRDGSPPARRKDRGAGSSYIRVTFEGEGGHGGPVAHEGEEDARADDLFIARRGLESRDRES